MSAPKNSEHNDARYNGRHFFDSGQERFDIVRDALRRDHQHCDREGERGVDKSFQPRHLNPAQPKSAEPRQPIQVRRQARCDFSFALVHPANDITALPARTCRANFDQRNLDRDLAKIYGARTFRFLKRSKPIESLPFLCLLLLLIVTFSFASFLIFPSHLLLTSHFASPARFFQTLRASMTARCAWGASA